MNQPRSEKEKRAFIEADQMVTALGKRWDATGVILMVAFAKSTGNREKPDEVEVSVMNITGGSEAFKDHLPLLLRCSADSAEEAQGIPHKCELQDEKPGEFPKFLTDLLRKERPGTN